MAQNIDVYDTFGGCTTQQQVNARLNAMTFAEIREIMTSLGCTVAEIDLKVCRLMGIKCTSKYDQKAAC